MRELRRRGHRAVRSGRGRAPQARSPDRLLQPDRRRVGPDVRRAPFAAARDPRRSQRCCGGARRAVRVRDPRRAPRAGRAGSERADRGGGNRRHPDPDRAPALRRARSRHRRGEAREAADRRATGRGRRGRPSGARHEVGAPAHERAEADAGTRSGFPHGRRRRRDRMRRFAKQPGPGTSIGPSRGARRGERHPGDGSGSHAALVP